MEIDDLECSNCRYFEEIIDRKGGLCRRHAPRPTVPRSPSASVSEVCWPVVDADDYCGEHSHFRSLLSRTSPGDGSDG